VEQISIKSFVFHFGTILPLYELSISFALLIDSFLAA
jgi:hypothetical protein